MKRWLLPVAEIVAVGIPFCAFKLITGVILISSISPVGYALVVLGSIDLVLNALNLVTLLVLRHRVTSVCVAELALGSSLGLAVDVFVSFGLVAIVIGAGLLSEAPPETLPLWNIAVVLNVLGAGVGRLLEAIRSRSSSAA